MQQSLSPWTQRDRDPLCPKLEVTPCQAPRDLKFAYKVTKSRAQCQIYVAFSSHKTPYLTS